MTDAELLAQDIILRLDRITFLLESIDARLKQRGEDVGRCGHGTTGLCMSCVIQHDLLRPKQEGRF